MTYHRIHLHQSFWSRVQEGELEFVVSTICHPVSLISVSNVNLELRYSGIFSVWWRIVSVKLTLHIFINRKRQEMRCLSSPRVMSSLDSNTVSTHGCDWVSFWILKSTSVSLKWQNIVTQTSSPFAPDKPSMPGFPTWPYNIMHW